MRRKDREMSEEFAYMVAEKCEWAVFAMIDTEGEPYCVPITIALDGKTVYFHSGPEGHKVEALRNNSAVCISCVGDTYRTPDKFTTEFESAIIRGKAELVESEEEQIHGLRLICQRHTPTNMDEFDAMVKKSLFRTCVWKVEVESITGKRKKYDKDGVEMKFGRSE